MSSLKVCTSEVMLSTVTGLGMAACWFPSILTEAFLESTKDGDIKLSPDPVTMIDGDLTWFNNSGVDIDVWVHVHRAPRSIVAQSPSTVVIHDAWSHKIGVNPSADYPSVAHDTFGGRLQMDRASVAADSVQYARWFMGGDDSQAFVHLGTVPDQQAFHFRYLAAVQTPGVWVEPTSDNWSPRWEATANWARLQALGTPAMT